MMGLFFFVAFPKKVRMPLDNMFYLAVRQRRSSAGNIDFQLVILR